MSPASETRAGEIYCITQRPASIYTVVCGLCHVPLSQCGCNCFDEAAGDNFASTLARESAAEALGLPSSSSLLGLEKKDEEEDTPVALVGNEDTGTSPATAVADPSLAPSSLPTAAPSKNRSVVEFGTADESDGYYIDEKEVDDD